MRLPLSLASHEKVHEHVERCCYNDESGYVHGSLLVTSERIVFVPEENTVACVSVPLRAIAHVNVQRNEMYTTLQVCEKMKAARTFRTVIEHNKYQNQPNKETIKNSEENRESRREQTTIKMKIEDGRTNTTTMDEQPHTAVGCRRGGIYCWVALSNSVQVASTAYTLHTWLDYHNMERRGRCHA